MDLLSYLVPSRMNAQLLRHGIGAGDLLANKFRAEMPDDVGIAWREHLRPALMKWLDKLAQEEPR